MQAEQVNIRELALETLLLFEKEENRKLGDIMHAVLEKYAWLPKNQRSFYTRLTAGTLEQKILLDYVIGCYSKTPVKKMKPVIRNILRLGVYQIREMDAVPDGAAVNEAVKLAGRKGFRNLKGFVNGILRSVIRQPEKLEFPPKENTAQYLSVMYSMPPFLIEKWVTAYGAERTEALCKAFTKEAKTTIRLRGSEEEQKQCLQALERDGVQIQKAPYLPYAYYISGYDRLEELEAFQEGRFLVQDLSSMLAVEAAGIQKREGLQILDLCAAPGGKSLLAADKAGEQSTVRSRDVSERKTELIRENARRCKTENIQVQTGDAREFEEALEGKMDLVIADVPCSGYGVIRHKPDIKYGACTEKEASLIEIQREILQNAVRYVKLGGRLLYSTCTINRAENEEQAEWIAAQSGMKYRDLTKDLPQDFAGTTAKEGYIQLLPGEFAGDGFFIAGFEKDES